MPRAARISFENAFYHVFNRGLAKQAIFLDNEDYQQFLHFLADLKTKYHYDYSIYAYVLMPNHFHLLIQSKKTPLVNLMKSLIIRYVIYFNRKYQRVGVLFQNRFKSKLCQKDAYFIGVSRYIHLNPIAARLTSDINTYKWSSYQELYGKTDLSIIDKEEVKSLIGDKLSDKIAYKQFLLDGLDKYAEIEQEYSFESEISGSAKFNTLTQKKFLRRRDKSKNKLCNI